jgi:outer membrane receptor protein involved in Fe transport
VHGAGYVGINFKLSEKKMVETVGSRAAYACLSAVSLSAFLLAASGEACAQVQGQPDVIIVTASKREQVLSEIPMSVIAIEGDTLKKTGGSSFEDFSALTPGLSYTDSGPGAKRYALRGLQSAGDPEVALYYDEIPVLGLPGASLDTGDSQLDLRLWDVDRIEVLNGPQGTLYGSGAMGGAIRILSNRPRPDRFAGEAAVSVGSTEGGNGSWGANGFANIPLGGKAGLRVVGGYLHDGGWIDDLPRLDIAVPQLGGRNRNDDQTWGGRAGLRIEPTEGWTVDATAWFQRTDTGAAFDTYPQFATTNDRYVSKAFVQTPWREKAELYSLTSTRTADDFEIVFTASYQDRTLRRTIDTTRFLLQQFGCDPFTWNKTCFTPPLLPAASFSLEEVEAWTGEARIASRSQGRLSWTAGVFLQSSDTDRNGQVAKVDADGDILFDSKGTALGRLFSRINHDTFDQEAVFGEVGYKLTPTLTATIGGRWFSSKRTDQQTIVQQFFPGQPIGDQPFQKFDESKLFQKYELAWTPQKGILAFLSAAEGFRAGGPNYPGGFALTAPPYRSDSVWDYELGWKATLATAPIYVEGSVFDLEWHNLQQLIPASLFSYIANAGAARSQGFEGRVQYRPMTSLSINAGVTYNHAALVGEQPDMGAPSIQVHAGDKLANVPEWISTTTVEWDGPNWNGAAFSALIDANYKSTRGSVVAPQNPDYMRIKSGAVINLHLNARKDLWRASFEISNLLDRFVEISGRPLDSNLVDGLTAARPRTIRLTTALNF